MDQRERTTTRTVFGDSGPRGRPTRLLLAMVLCLSATAACGDDDDGAALTATSATETSDDPVIVDDGPPAELDYSGPPLPVSTEFAGTGALAEPWPFDTTASDCGFESVYGPSATCTIVAGDLAAEPFTLVLHELESRTVAFVGCGDDETQFPTLTVDDGREVGVWQTTETGPTDPAGYVISALDEEWVLVSIVSSDDGIGEDGCPVVYGVGEFTTAVSITNPGDVLRIEDGDIRYCISKAGPGEFRLSDSGYPTDPC